MLGFDDGNENLHYLLESAFCGGADGDELSLPFLRALENSQPFETNPIFAVLHEMCYTQGAAARWSAERVRAEFPDMDWAPGRPPSFTGEMIYPWMFEDYAGLRPLREVAELLAAEERWPVLYDPAQLARNTVPVRRRDLRRGHVRAARAVGGDRGVDRRHEGLAHQRIRAQRPAQQRRRVRAAARAAAGEGLASRRCDGEWACLLSTPSSLSGLPKAAAQPQQSSRHSRL